MKHFLILGMLAVASCKTIHDYVQVYEIKPLTPLSNHNSVYTFENDTVKISYAFFAERGVLAFSVFNKLDIPLYIDWKKSSYIKNDDKIDYWQDEEKIKSRSYLQSYSVNALWWEKYYSVYPSYWQPTWLGASSANMSTETTRTKPERITFLAPHSTYYRGQFRLFNAEGTKLRTDRDCQTVTTLNYYNKPVESKLYTADYNPSESALHFRNFLTFSTSEKFEKEFYTDNGFYVAKISEVDAIAFTTTYQKACNFFVKINPFLSIDFRKQEEVDSIKQAKRLF
jgi:hypothetical protein